MILSEKSLKKLKNHGLWEKWYGQTGKVTAFRRLIRGKVGFWAEKWEQYHE